MLAAESGRQMILSNGMADFFNVSSPVSRERSGTCARICALLWQLMPRLITPIFRPTADICHKAFRTNDEGLYGDRQADVNSGHLEEIREAGLRSYLQERSRGRSCRSRKRKEYR